MAPVWAKRVHLKGSAPENNIFIEIVKAICVLALNRCLGGLQLCHGCDLGVWRNLQLQFNDRLFHGNFINTVPYSVV